MAGRSTPGWLRLALAGIAAGGSLLAPGCASADLSGDARVSGEVAECLPPGTPAPLVVARAVWFPNADGFRTADETGMGRLAGVVALAGNRLWFMAWDDTVHQYGMRHVVEVLSAEKVEVARLGTASILVVESRNRSFDSYELMYGQELGSDTRATEDLCGRIQALRLGHPDRDR